MKPSKQRKMLRVLYNPNLSADAVVLDAIMQVSYDYIEIDVDFA